MKTLLARLALMASGEPEGTTLADVAFSLYTAWAQHCLDLAEQDKLQGFSLVFNPPISGMSQEEMKDKAFDLHLNDTEELQEFVTTYAKQLELDPANILREMAKYIKVTGRDE